MQETQVRSLGSPGVGKSNPLQSSCLENSRGREAWWATVHGVAKSQTWLSDWAQHMSILLKTSTKMLGRVAGWTIFQHISLEISVMFCVKFESINCFQSRRWTSKYSWFDFLNSQQSAYHLKFLFNKITTYVLLLNLLGEMFCSLSTFSLVWNVKFNLVEMK